jgi:hypothetical protein
VQAADSAKELDLEGNNTNKCKTHMTHMITKNTHETYDASMMLQREQWRTNAAWG